MVLDAPLIYPRKAVKDHGTGRAVEGAYEPGQRAVAVEDVVTSGGSLLRAVGSMEDAGLEVRDAVVLVDREQGGRERLAEAGYTLHAVLTLTEILGVLRDEGRISAETFAEVEAYLAS
jgi:uridine monophosphate synthetase